MDTEQGDRGMSNDHAYELRELMTNFVHGFGAMGEAARKALEGLELTPAAEEPADEPDRFEHTDDHGDSVGVAVSPVSRFVLELDTSTTAEIYLDQGAVNRLAQYLDRHRTDGPKVPVNVRGWTGPDDPNRCRGDYEGFRCRRLNGHDGEHA